MIWKPPQEQGWHTGKNVERMTSIREKAGCGHSCTSQFPAWTLARLVQHRPREQKECHYERTEAR